MTRVALERSTRARAALGDAHNFGRRVAMRGRRVRKPRTLLWEWLVLSGKSPLRRVLDAAAAADPLGEGAFAFLPDLAFSAPRARAGGEVERVVLRPLTKLSREGRTQLARVVGRAIALFTWLGVADLHWENLVLGAGARGRIIFAPLDVEMILAELSLPTQTKLLPDADPEYADVCRHACGVRRALPYLGKPVAAADVVAMAAAYDRALAFLDRHARALADAVARVPGVREAPIRVLLRGTGEYVRALEAPAAPIWPPLLVAEEEQLARGDIPYFFRLYGRRGIHYFADRALRSIGTLPLRGDVPQLDPMLSLARGLRSRARATLRAEGLFTLLGAFDDAALRGTHADGDFAVTFGARTLTVTRGGEREALSSTRSLRAFVGSVYLPCRCGEVRAVFVPPVTACVTGRRPRARTHA